ncbi:MAG: NAD-dependent epimerase/dehydratase family protein [Desulfarculus sp.]|nr:NAD-dependent epimerase/dehydratase family protein [Desulfarculus sp.]
MRPSAVYGPTDVNRRVVQIFLEKALAGETLVLHGGDSTLDFTYVEDIASGFVLAGTHPQAANQVFNITRGQGRTLKELVDVLKLYFPTLETRIEPHRVYRPKRGSLSIAKAREVLGFEPRFTLEEGIGRYVEFYRKSNSC